MSSSSIPKPCEEHTNKWNQRKTIYQERSLMSTNLTNWCQETRKSPQYREQKHNGIQENAEFRE